MEKLGTEPNLGEPLTMSTTVETAGSRKTARLQPQGTVECVVFDMDGTLANTVSLFTHFEDRSIPRPLRMIRFQAEAAVCDPNEHVLAEALRLQAEGVPVVVLTARFERWREITEFTLETFGLTPDELIMRPNGDELSDAESKAALVQEMQARGWCPKMFWEDNESVANMLTDRGYSVTVVEADQSLQR